CRKCRLSKSPRREPCRYSQGLLRLILPYLTSYPGHLPPYVPEVSANTASEAAFLLEVATLFISSSLKSCSSNGSSTSRPKNDERCIALESISPFMPSLPSATSGSPLKIAAAHALSTPTCCSFLPSSSTSICVAFGQPNGTLFVLENSCSPISSSQTESLPYSAIILARSSWISNLFVPQASPVVVINTPVAPFSYSTYAVTSSSTSMSCHLP